MTSTLTSETQPKYTFHSDLSSKYFLPNDAQERHRLRVQHEAIIAFMHDEPIHAPVPTIPGPTKILDIGCGVNASMTLILAKKFPNATIYGVDLSPIDIEHKPSNVSFIQGNVHNLIDKDERLQRGSADYIFSRYVAAGVDNWPEHIKSLSTLLAPGGHLELHDTIRPNWRDENDNEISRDWKWLELMNGNMFWPSNDPTGVNYFRSIMRDCGLLDVASKLYKLTSSDNPEARLWTEYARGLFRTSFLGPIYRMFPGLENEEKGKELERQVFEDMEPKPGVYFPCVVVWGRKGSVQE